MPGPAAAQSFYLRLSVLGIAYPNTEALTTYN